MADDPLSLPESLKNITGIGKERIAELKARSLLGLSLRADEPMVDSRGEIVEWMSVIRFMNNMARRYMAPSNGKPLEDSPEWREEKK